MQDRPTALELLETVADYLDDDLLPALDGPLAYRTRVAANLVHILAREQALGPAALARERERLLELLGLDPTVPPSTPIAAEVMALNARLVAAIAAGRVTHAQVWAPLLEIARAKLAIVRPGYDGYDASGELP